MNLTDFDDITRDMVNARRNYLMGIWAGRQLGLEGEKLDRYVEDVMASDREEPGPFDVVRKVHADLSGAQVRVDEHAVLDQLKEYEGTVRDELLTTD